MRAVVDPNVLVSAQISSLGHPARLRRAADEGRFEIIVSEKLLAELSTVLMRPRFRCHMSEDEVAEAIENLRGKGSLFEDVEEGRLVPDDPKDDYLIALSRASAADFLVSGYPHLHGLESPPEVLTPRRFWELLERERKPGGRDLPG
jgi:putative PIN family toxin of toxin-antitoxin system